MSDAESNDRGAVAVRARLGEQERGALAGALARAEQARVAERVRDCDATLWGPEGTPEIANRLGWVTIAGRMLGDIDDLAGFAEELAREGTRDVVLLGMGGSSLAPEVFRRTFQGEERGASLPRDSAASPRLSVLDSTNAGAVRAVTEAIDPQHTLFLVSSKSGGTIEPLSMLAHFWESTPHGARFAAITDPGSGLERLARERGFRRVFHGDPEIGGRYSALSPFGIVPAALIGVDVARLLEGAAAAWDTPIEPDDPTAAPAWLWLGTALGALAKAGRNKLTFHVAPALDGLGLWLEQLVAESTGKHGTGILPVAEEPLGEPGDYGEDRVFVHISDTRSSEEQVERRLRALSDAGHPTITIPTSGPTDLGRVFMLAELCVAVAGWELSINPFDQPNVQEAKDATKKVLDEIEQGNAPAAPADASNEELRELLGGAAPPAYVAIMGYVEPSVAFDAAVAELRSTLMRARQVTTTFGYGPRFLHSTGQFHKGGPPIGRFLQLLHDSKPDVEIPHKPYSFTTLEHAQADGDLQTLRAHELPAGRVTLTGEDPAAALRELTAEVARMLDSGASGATAAGTSREG